jgi:hypothetical protein
VRRLAFLALNAGAVVLVCSGVAMPVADFFSAREAHLAEQRNLLARLHAIAANEPHVREAAKQTEAQFKRGELLSGANEGAINADLQTRLKAMAERAGARLRSVQGLPPKESERIKYAGSRLEIQGSLAAIHRTVHAIENGAPYLFIAAATLKPAAAANPNGIEEPPMEARIDVFAAIKSEDRAQ